MKSKDVHFISQSKASSVVFRYLWNDSEMSPTKRPSAVGQIDLDNPSAKSARPTDFSPGAGPNEFGRVRTVANSPSHGAMYAMLARLLRPFLISS